MNEAQAAAKPAAEPAAELTSPKEIAFRDSLADQIIEGSPEVQKLQATIALKQAKLKEIEEAVRDGKNAADYKRKAAEIAKHEKLLEKAREEMKPRPATRRNSVSPCGEATWRRPGPPGGRKNWRRCKPIPATAGCFRRSSRSATSATKERHGEQHGRGGFGPQARRPGPGRKGV